MSAMVPKVGYCKWELTQDNVSEEYRGLTEWTESKKQYSAGGWVLGQGPDMNSDPLLFYSYVVADPTI